MEKSQQPNIILIMADQWAAASVGSYGCEIQDVSPNIDELASRGVQFERHYANCPACAPSRASIFTGRSPAIHGIFDNNLELTGDTPLFTQELRSSGYRTSGFGKFHFSAMQHYPPGGFSHLGLDDVIITEDPKHGSWLEWIRKEHPEYYECALAMSWPMPYLGGYPPDERDLREEWQEAYKTWLAPRMCPPHRKVFYPSPLPAELHQTHWITDQALAMLESEQDKDNRSPFFMFVSYVDPHDPYDPPEPYSDLFDWRTMPQPIPQEWTRDFCAREYPLFQDTMFELDTFDAETWARLRAHFYGSCRFIDDQIGRLMARLRESGLKDDTVVIFTTDHGEMIGDHGLLMKGPWHYDRTVRCPLIISGPGVDQNQSTSALTCTLDIAPSILNLAGAQLEVPLEGRTLPTIRADINAFDGPSHVELESNGSYVDRESQSRTLISNDNWRLTIFPGQEYGELFDLSNDPQEQRNLFAEPSHRDRRLDMTEKLVGAMARQVYPFPPRNRAEGIAYEGAPDVFVDEEI